MSRWALALALLIACSDDEEAPPPVPRCSTGKGIVTGDISFQGELRPGAFALVRKDPEDLPLQVQSDEQGHYNVALAAGHWLIDARDGDFCNTLEAVEVSVLNCTEHRADLQLDCVLGGGGAGGAGGAGGSGGSGG